MSYFTKSESGIAIVKRSTRHQPAASRNWPYYCLLVLSRKAELATMMLPSAASQKLSPIRARLNLLCNHTTKIRRRTAALRSPLYHDFGDRTNIGRKLLADAFDDSSFNPG
jgi:hypothetical protein